VPKSGFVIRRGGGTDACSQNSARWRQIIDLPSSGGECTLDSVNHVFMRLACGWGAIDYDILVRRKRDPDFNREAGPMMVFVTGRDHRYTTPNDVVIVLFQTLNLASNRDVRSLRRLSSFKIHLKRNLHNTSLN
jgi:hypothetical protein